MKRCRYRFLLACAAFACASGAAYADDSVLSRSKGWADSTAIAASDRGSPSQDLDFLFGALQAAPDQDSAKAIENRIWAQWLASGSDTVDLLMRRAKAAVEKEELDVALRLLDAIVEIRPQFTEAWNRRATVFYLKKDYGSALSDLRQVLRREPRHFAALAGLGTIMQDIGHEEDALGAFRRAAELYPQLKGMAEKIRSLTERSMASRSEVLCRNAADFSRPRG